MPSQGKSEWFDSCDWPSNLTQIVSKSSMNQPVWPWNLMNDLEKTTRHLIFITSNFVHHFKSIGEFKLEWLEMLNSDKNWRFFVLHELEIWWMTLKNKRAPLLYYIKLCAAFQSQWHIQTGVTVQKRSIRVKLGDFLSRVTLKIDVWPWKTIGHLFYTTSSFVYHFKSIGEVKLELQPGNAQVG